MTENLARWVGGQRLDRFEVTDAKLLREGDPVVLDQTEVQRVWRRAKYTVVEVPDARLVLHYRMTGKVVPAPCEGRVRARFVLADGRCYAFKDQRRLAEAWVLEPDELEGFFEARSLGPEPWPAIHDGAWWAERYVGLRGPIKPALLRQDRVCGLGNIAASEICWRAGIAPTRSVRDITEQEWARLASVIPGFLDQVIRAERSDEIVLVEEGGQIEVFSVYKAAGQPCSRCGGIVERLVQAGRSTFWCPGCQA